MPVTSSNNPRVGDSGATAGGGGSGREVVVVVVQTGQMTLVTSPPPAAAALSPNFLERHGHTQMNLGVQVLAHKTAPVEGPNHLLHRLHRHLAMPPPHLPRPSQNFNSNRTCHGLLYPSSSSI